MSASDIFGNIIFPACAFVIVASAVLRGVLIEYYARSRPKVPDPERGFIYPLKAKGTTVYLAHGESYFFDRRARWTLWVPGALGVVSLMASSLLKH